MKNYIKIAVIGGTGKAGKYLVEQLIENGYSFKALVRNRKNFTIENPLVEVIYGNVCDIEIVRTLLFECNAVISTLGMGIPFNNPIVCSSGTANILKVMLEFGINRYIVVTGLNVDTPFDKKSPTTKFATDWMYQHYPETTADRQKEYELLSTTNLDWTLIRIPLIKLTDQRFEIKVDLYDCPADSISATNLALFLIEQLNDKAYSQKAPFIAHI